MKHALFIVAGLISLAWPAQAQKWVESPRPAIAAQIPAIPRAGSVVLKQRLAYWQSRDSGYNTSVGASPSYQGPGDVVSGAISWYGLRAYSAADRGNRLVNVCIPADAACADLVSDSTTGNLVIPTIGGSSCGIVACTIKTFYNRGSGANLDVTQATANKRTTLVVNCQNGLPCANANNSQTNTYASSGSLTQAQPLTISFVAIRQINFTTQQDVIGIANGPVVAGFAPSTNNLDVYAGTSQTATASNNAWHAIQIVYSGSSSVANVDNTETIVNPGTNGAAGIVTLIDNGFSNNFSGEMTEIGAWGGGFSAGQRTNMCHNQFVYWATATSC